MSMYSLPSRIKNILSESFPGLEPVHTARFSGTPFESSGETYILVDETQTYLLFRAIGQSDYSMEQTRNEAISDPRIMQDRYDEYLAFSMHGQDIALRFARYDQRQIQDLIRFWETFTPATDADADSSLPTTPPEEIPPSVGFLALLIYIATVDGELDDREETYIENLCNHDQESLKQALVFYKSAHLEDLIQSISEFDHSQKLCLLTNLTEVAMSDGILDSKEQNLLETISNALNIDQDEMMVIRDVMLAKNKVSVVGL